MHTLRRHPVVAFAVLAILAAALIFAVGCGSEDEADVSATGAPADEGDGQRYDGETLMVYAGAAMRKPRDEIARVFQEQYGCTIQYTYAGSAQNLSQIELTGEGDIYVPGDESYTDITVEKSLSEEAQPVVLHIPAIAVPKGNPAGITSLEDLAKPGVDVVLGDPESASIGKLTLTLLEDAGLLDGVQQNVVAQTATEPEMVVYLSTAQADAGIIWEDNIFVVEDIEAIEIPAEQNKIKTIPVAVLKSTTNHELAQLFADFVASDETEPIWAEYGSKPAE